MIESGNIKISPLVPVAFRSFPFHFSQIVSQSSTGLSSGRGSSCCWSHPPPLQPCCPSSQAFGTSPESEASKHECQGLKCTQQLHFVESKVTRVIRMIRKAWTKLTKVDSCRLLFFRCFLCFFPSTSSSSFFPCPFCGTACHQHWVNILKVSRRTHQTTNQSRPALMQVSWDESKAGQDEDDTLWAMASLLPSVKASHCFSYFLLHHRHWFTAERIQKVKIW